MVSPQTLQPDVLKEIFEHLAAVHMPSWQPKPGSSSDPSMFYTLGWIYVTHVCQHWRAIGVDLAGLWAEIVCSLPNPSATEVILRRSKGCPLEVEILYGKSSPERIAFALEHLHRIKRLTCYPPNNWQEHLRERGPLLALRHLQLAQEARNIPVTLPLDAPHLQTLKLDDATLSSITTSQPFQDLHTLSIAGLNSLPIPAWEIFNMLSQTPLLKHLFLHLVLPPGHIGRAQWDDYPGKPIHLAHLKTMTLRSGSRVDVGGFWQHIVAPDNVDVDISFQSYHPARLVVLLDKQLRQSSHDTSTVTLRPGQSSLSFTSSKADSSQCCGRLNLTIYEPRSSAMIELLGHLNDSAHLPLISCLTLRFYQPYLVDRPALLAFVRRCSSATDVTIGTNQLDNLDILRRKTDEGTMQFFPNMTTLSLRFNPPAPKATPPGVMLMSWPPTSTAIYSDWCTRLRELLELRAGAGMGLRTLRLVGKWGWRAADARETDEKMMNALWQFELVEELIEERSWLE